MKKKEKPWRECTHEEKRARILAELGRRSLPARVIADRLIAPWSEIEDLLGERKAEGTTLANGRKWYRRDVEVRPPMPKRSRVTAKQRKNLERQGGFGFE